MPLRVSPHGAKKPRESWSKMARRRKSRPKKGGGSKSANWLQQQSRGLKGYS